MEGEQEDGKPFAMGKNMEDEFPAEEDGEEEFLADFWANQPASHRLPVRKQPRIAAKTILAKARPPSSRTRPSSGTQSAEAAKSSNIPKEEREAISPPPRTKKAAQPLPAAPEDKRIQSLKDRQTSGGLMSLFVGAQGLADPFSLKAHHKKGPAAPPDVMLDALKQANLHQQQMAHLQEYQHLQKHNTNHKPKVSVKRRGQGGKQNNPNQKEKKKPASDPKKRRRQPTSEDEEDEEWLPPYKKKKPSDPKKRRIQSSTSEDEEWLP